MRRLFPLFARSLVLILVLTIAGCGDDDDNASATEEEAASCPEPTLDLEVCDLSAGPFSLTIDNEFFPLVVGTEFVLEGTDDEGVTILLEITVLDETEDVGGVTTRVVEEAEYEDDELIEVSRNFFAQAADGTVCYFGEDVDIYEDGEIVSNEGEWRAGVDENLPGIYMPAEPEVGMVFFQEFAPDLATDIAEIVALGDEIDVDAGVFDNTLTAEDCNPLEDEIEIDEKVYVSGIGLAIDEDAELVSF